MDYQVVISYFHTCKRQWHLASASVGCDDLLRGRIIRAKLEWFTFINCDSFLCTVSQNLSVINS